jgi:curved DNA-binding protein CbpA
MINLYQILDVSPNSTHDEIKANFRRKALQFHPDRNVSNPWAEEQFKKVAEAYKILGDEQKRQTYDHQLRQFYGPNTQTQPQDSPVEWISNALNFGMNIFENYARTVADEVTTTYEPPDEIDQFLSNLSLSMRKDKNNNVVLKLEFNPQNQRQLLSLCTRQSLDSISEDIGELISEKVVNYFERKWGRNI